MKAIVLVATAALLLTLTACNKSSDTPRATSSDTNTTTAAPAPSSTTDTTTGPAASSSTDATSASPATTPPTDAKTNSEQTGGDTTPSPVDPAQAHKTGANVGDGASYSRSSSDKQ